MRALIASIAASLLLVAACGDEDEPVAAGNGSTTSVTQPTTTAPPVGSEQARLDVARRQWGEAGPDRYRLTWTLLCFCPRSTFVDTVVDGEVVEHREAPESEAFDDPGPKTTDAIFDEVQAAIDSDPFSLEVVYDDETGAVVSYFVDEQQNIADEEHGLEVEVEPLDDGTFAG